MKARSVHDILEGKEALPPEQAIPLALDLYRVLESLHKQGKTLGGIYPDQVLLQDGLAQILELAAPRVPEDVTLSYLGFVPPETFEGQTAGVTSDIYSAGIILYVLLTGRIPFAAPDREQLSDNIRQARYENFPQFAGFPQLDWILKKSINRVPSRRFTSVQELSQELRKVWKPMRATQGSAAAPAATGVTVRKLQRQGREYHRLLLEHWKIAAAAAGIVILVVLAFLLWPEKIRVDHTVRNWNVRQLTSTPDPERDPSLSPDGQTIAYVSRMTGNWEIYIRGFSGGEPKQITESPGRESQPRWSPDGQLILFTYESPGIEPTVFSVPPTGGIPQKMADNAVDAQWSPDGKSICYVTPAAPGVRKLEIFDLGGLSTRTIVESIQGLAHPTFSADGKKIACEADSDQGHKLFLVDTTSGKMKAIPKVEGFAPTWDWSTGWIYFNAIENGSRKIQRTDPGGFVQEVTPAGGNSFLPVPTANGSAVLFYREVFDRDVFRIDPEAPLPERVSPVPAESALPRSVSAGTLLFVRGRDPNLQLQAAIFGGSVSTVLNSIRANSLFSISPDGSFVYAEDPQDGKKGLWQVALNGGNAIGLGEHMAAPYEITPDRRKLFYSVRKDNAIRYLIKDLKSQEEVEVSSLSMDRRILRASWLDNGSTILFLTADNVLSQYNVRDAKISNVLENCHDFSLRPRSNSIAALVGKELNRASLAVVDLNSRRQRSITSFEPDAFAAAVDWSRDGLVIYYDRYKAGSDLFVAE